MDDEEAITFCTLGMFIIDEIDYCPPTPPVKNILGGAGSYAAIGARIVTPRSHSRSVGWTVDMGSDFPPAIEKTIHAWKTSCVFRYDASRLTTRGWNGYGENEQRAFKYLTPKLRLDQHSLNDSQLLAKSFHLICSPKRCIDLVEGILERRRKLGRSATSPRPLFVWEPVPDLCVPEELSAFLKAIRHVDIVSPNESELAGFFGKSSLNLFSHGKSSLLDEVLRAGIGPHKDGALVVRLGKDGCYCNWKGEDFRFPSYHGAVGKARGLDGFETCQLQQVVDPTGGGNAFLGAFAQALVIKVAKDGYKSDGYFGHRDDGTVVFDTAQLIHSMIWALLSASFVIEQIGLPASSYDEHGNEMWNEEQVAHRMAIYRKSLRCAPKEDVGHLCTENQTLNAAVDPS